MRWSTGFQDRESPRPARAASLKTSTAARCGFIEEPCSKPQNLCHHIACSSTGFPCWSLGVMVALRYSLSSDRITPPVGYSRLIGCPPRRAKLRPKLARCPRNTVARNHDLASPNPLPHGGSAGSLECRLLRRLRTRRARCGGDAEPIPGTRHVGGPLAFDRSRT